MCNFFSAIVTPTKVLWDSKIDSHTQLIETFKLKDDTKEPNFVRVEIVPPDYSEKSFRDVSLWKFKTDQDLLPKWYKEKHAKIKTIEAVEEYIKKYVHFSEKIKEIKDGRHFLFGSSVVQEMWDSSVKILSREKKIIVPKGVYSFIELEGGK